MSVMALVGAAAASMPGAGANKPDPAFGLGFRFTVKIDDVDLGGWQACSGLKVEFKSTEVKFGGDYVTQRWLPDKVAHPKVVLKRAVELTSSGKVQDWLSQAGRAWIESGASSKASMATITLYDSGQDPVLTWFLTNVRPSAWSGPDLDATSSKVAIETLELIHEGFTAQPGSGKKADKKADNKPGPKDDQLPKLAFDDKTVTFKIPPEKLGLEFRASDMRGASTTEPNSTDAYLPGVTTYSLSGVILEGRGIRKDVNQLIAWATPKAKKTDGKAPPCPPHDAKSGDDKKAGSVQGGSETNKIEFTWGTAFQAVVQIKQISATYVRFDAKGEPTRAQVTLKLQLVKDNAPDPAPGGTKNPTSGGIEGRGTLQVIEGDTLPLLARQHYGDAGAWRELASANAIDDPLRVRPGRQLYLPAPSELGSAS